MTRFSIAIDGPAGAGKSTIAKMIAGRLGFVYVDTGAMYRAMALYFIRNHIDPADSSGIEQACGKVDITIAYHNGEQYVLLNGKNVNAFIRSEEVGNMASATSTNRAVRVKLVKLQQALAKKEDVVMDGRDIGTVVLPDADLKIFLSAGVKERAKRRWAQLKEKGMTPDIAVIEKDIAERDYRDMNRDFAPLQQAKDAVFIDSSDMTIDEVADKIIRHYENRKAGKG
jgi:cytidylate kinase